MIKRENCFSFMENDIYDISGRIKNIIAREDLAMSPAGNILVNYFSLFLKDLYDFSYSLNSPCDMELRRILNKSENIPLNIIKVSSPKERLMTIYDELENMKTKFKTNEEALEHFTTEYEELGSEYGMTGDEFWFDAESSPDLTEDYRKIMRLRRSIDMCNYLIKKEKE